MCNSSKPSVMNVHESAVVTKQLTTTHASNAMPAATQIPSAAPALVAHRVPELEKQLRQELMLMQSSLDAARVRNDELEAQLRLERKTNRAACTAGEHLSLGLMHLGSALAGAIGGCGSCLSCARKKSDPSWTQLEENEDGKPVIAQKGSREEDGVPRRRRVVLAMTAA